MFDKILNYLKHASTWRGLIGLATAAGVVISSDLATEIIASGIALTSLINVFRNG